MNTSRNIVQDFLQNTELIWIFKVLSSVNTQLLSLLPSTHLNALYGLLIMLETQKVRKGRGRVFRLYLINFLTDFFAIITVSFVIK